MPKSKQFNRQEVLSKAMEVFWQQGYDATSIQDLIQATGLKPGSIYDTFGDKHGLFVEVLQHYRHKVISTSLSVLLTPGSARQAIEAYFVLITEKFAQPDHQFGCLMANSTAQLIVPDTTLTQVVSDHLQTIEAAFIQVLERGVATGEISPKQDVTQLARFLTTCVVGLSVVAKTPQAISYFPASVEAILSTFG